MKPNVYTRAPIEGIWEYHGKVYLVKNYSKQSQPHTVKPKWLQLTLFLYTEATV